MSCPMDYIRPAFMLITISTCGVLLIHFIRTLNCNISTCCLLKISISVPCDHRTGCQLMGLTVPLTMKVEAHKTTKVVDVDACWCSRPSSPCLLVLLLLRHGLSVLCIRSDVDTCTLLILHWRWHEREDPHWFLPAHPTSRYLPPIHSLVPPRSLQL